MWHEAVIGYSWQNAGDGKNTHPLLLKNLIRVLNSQDSLIYKQATQLEFIAGIFYPKFALITHPLTTDSHGQDTCSICREN